MAAVCAGSGASWLLTLAGWQEDVLGQLCGERKCPGSLRAGKRQSEKNTEAEVGEVSLSLAFHAKYSCSQGTYHVFLLNITELIISM